MSADIRDAALAYAARGWRVFVLSASKKPLRNCDRCREEHTSTEAMEACECLTCHGFYAGTTEPDRINAMLDRHPRGCLAIRTGAASGLAVVDVDFRDWTEPGVPAETDAAWRTMGKLDARRLLPGTLMASTGSGGLHFYYAHPCDGHLMSGAGQYGPGIDSKAYGGYVVAPPSVTSSGRRYRWTPDGRGDHPLTPLPEELAAMIRPRAYEPPVVVSAARVREAGAGAPYNRLRGLVDAVLRAPQGERNSMLHWAAKKAGQMIAAGELEEHAAVEVLQRAGAEVGLTDSEIGYASKGTIGSGLRKGRVMI